MTSCANMIKPDEARSLKKAVILCVGSKEKTVNLNTGDSCITKAMELVQFFSKDNKFSMQPVVNSIKPVIYKNKSIFPFPVAEESQLLYNREFALLKKQDELFSKIVVPTNYPPIDYIKKKEIAVKFLQDSKVFDAAIVINLSCMLNLSGVSVMGVSAGSLKASTALYVVVYNKNGDTIIEKQISGKSDSSIVQIMGVYNPTDVSKICAEASGVAMKNFAKWLNEEISQK